MSDVLEHLCDHLLAHHTSLSEGLRERLRAVLEPAMAEAESSAATNLMITSPTSRLRRVKSAVLASDRSLDAMYQQEWAELAVSSTGDLLLCYRHRDGLGDYAVVWSSATSLPETMLPALPEALAEALLDGDG